MEYPATHSLTLVGYKNKMKYVQFLHDASEIKIKKSDNDNDIVLQLPEKKPNMEIPVIELMLE